MYLFTLRENARGKLPAYPEHTNDDHSQSRSTGIDSRDPIDTLPHAGLSRARSGWEDLH